MTDMTTDTRKDTRAAGSARRREGREGGFALLVSLIAIVGLTALATGGFVLANAERRTSTNHQSSVEAFYLATAGLHDYLGTVSGAPTGTPPPFTYPHGEAQVTPSFVGTSDGGNAMYLVTSEGRYDPNDSGDPVTRSVATVSVLDASVVPAPPAAITSGGGVNKNGGSGLISGNDNCGAGAAQAGVRVPPGGYDGKEKVVEGDPAVEEVSNPFDGIATEEWWNGMLDGTVVPHDYVVTGDDASAQWPDYSNISGMPTTYIDKESVNLGDSQDGKGLLIIKGNATFKGNFDWDGIILVGGAITDNGQGTVEGGVMTGLNVLKGQTVLADDLEDTMNGTKKYLFDSCIAQQVQNATAQLVELPGATYEAF